MLYTKKVLDWTQKKFEEIDENTKHPILRAFGLGCIEGAIEGAVIGYPFLLVGSIRIIKKLAK